jgi:hypothetical protein
MASVDHGQLLLEGHLAEQLVDPRVAGHDRDALPGDCEHGAEQERTSEHVDASDAYRLRVKRRPAWFHLTPPGHLRDLGEIRFVSLRILRRPRF